MSGRGSKVGRGSKRGLNIGLNLNRSNPLIMKKRLDKTDSKRKLDRPGVPRRKGASVAIKHAKVIDRHFGPPPHEASGSLLSHMCAGVESKPLCMDYGVPWRTFIRLISLLTLGLGLLQLLVSGYTYVYVPNTLYGAWWAAPPIILSGFFGVFALNRGYVVTSHVMALLGVLCIVPAVIFYDSAYMHKLLGLQTCVELLPYPNPGINKEFGNTDGTLPIIAARCAEDLMSPTIACYCSNGVNLGDDGGYCMTFGTVRDGDCDIILNDYTRLVTMCVGVEGFTSAIAFFQVCVTGLVLFCLNKHPTPEELKALEEEGYAYASGLFEYSEEFGANTEAHHLDYFYGHSHDPDDQYEDEDYDDYDDYDDDDDYSDDEVGPNEYDPEAGGYWDEDGDFHHGFFAEDGEWVETDADGHELDDPPYREEQGRRKSGKNRTRR